MKDIGYEKGDICNRNGCIGIIDEHEKEGCCSCHINPPCSYCTEQSEYCLECGWEASEEQTPIVKYASYNDYLDRVRKHDIDLSLKMQKKLPITEFDYRCEGHTHFSMKKEGVYPDGMTSKEVYEKVKGSFGGRFTYFDNNVFKFIAYTD